MDNNKLIAEFMGLKYKSGDFFIPTRPKPRWVEGYVGGDWLSQDELKYHTSWDWLMPVVDKIESLGYVFTIQGGKAEYGEMVSRTRCFIVNDKLSSTYQAVVEFIKEYNNER